MDAERWQRLSPLLDALLEHAPAMRAQHLESLREEDPVLVADLEELLRLEAEGEDFLSEPLAPPIPTRRSGAAVGPYRLERMLGEGGMGQVWLAQRDDGLYQRRVALKLLRPGLADPNLRLRFTRERQILARLEHPHIARLLDAGISADGQPYLALEYVEGEPITDWCCAHAITIDARLHLFQQICRALSHAHANLIVHRDLKPSNILVTPLGEVRLLDFGIAKLLDSEDAVPERTRTGVRAFTLHYASPEQLRGEPVTTMTDVYALGMVLFELLADTRPYRLKRQSDAEWEDAILHADPQRPSLALLRNADGEGERDPIVRRRARMLAGDLDNIVLKALAKKPEQRYASVEAFAQDVQRYRDGKPVQARPQRLGYRIGKYIGRHRWALATAALVSAVLASALGIVAWQARTATEQAARAQAMQAFVVGLIGQAGSASTTGQVDLRALLDTGLQRVDRELQRQPDARAELYGVIAQLRLGIGDYRSALQILQRQAQLIDSLSRPPPALQIASASDIGKLHRLLGDPAACIASMEPHTDFVLAQQRRLPLQAAEFYSQSGRCHRANDDPATALRLYRRALGLRRELADAEPLVAESLADLAALDADAGRSERALQGYHAAQTKLQTSGSTRLPLMVDLERALCGLQRNQGQLLRAERSCNSALALGLELLGDQHPSTVDARRLLAAIHVDQGRLDEAEKEFQTTRTQLIARLGARHSDVARDDNSLGIIAWERGDARRALDSLDHAIAILRAGPSHMQLAGVLFNKAMVLHDMGADADALPLLREARDIRASRLSATHPLVGDTDRLIGEVDAALGNNDAAKRTLDAAVNATSAGYGQNHPHTLRARVSQARFLARTAPAAAVGVFDQIIARRGDDAEIAKLRWRARAYRAETDCRGKTRASSIAELDALLADMAATPARHGVLQREIETIRATCLVPTAKERPAATAPAVDQSGSVHAPRA